MLKAITAFLIALFAGIPIAFALGITGLVHVLALGNLSYLNIVVQRMFTGVNNISLICIPFFVMAGEIMNAGGVTKKLLDAVREVIGWLRGGLAYATVGVGMILSAILGSAQAVAAILCSVMIPEMEKDGYKKEYSGALIAASGVLGPIIPPSVVFVVYSVLANVSVKSLFIAGVVPGVLLGLGYAVMIFVQSRQPDFPKAKIKFDLMRMLKACFKAIPALLVPVVIIGGILTGIFTPTESGAVAVVVALLASVIYRTMDWKALPRMLLRAGMSSAGILLIIAFGNIVGWTMAIDGIAGKVSAGIFALTSNPQIVLLLMLFILIVVGCLMDTTAAMLVFVPVLLPIAMAIGMDPIHFGIIFCVMITIGMITPPVGLVLFVVSNVSDIALPKLSRSILPFVLVSFAITFVMAFFPDLVLWLPRLLQ
ncbi:MAG: TRAP transporter large permease [Clostridiales bacterium]|nr:TRAP transporter large permease [Clostridiales bacterium]